MWLVSTKHDGKLQFQVDSDAVIVNGLLALVMAVFNNKAAEEILDFDINYYLKELDLERHITPTRGNGLHAIVAKIKVIAKMQ